MEDFPAKLDPIQISRWQGKVDGILSSLDSRMTGLETQVNLMPDRIEKRFEKVLNNQKVQSVDFKWLMEKVALPLITGGGGAVLAIYALMKSM